MRIPTLILAFTITLNSGVWAQDLKTNEQYNLGISALNDHLYPLAISKLENALKVDKLSDQDKAEIYLAIVEAQIRASKSADALQNLAQPVLEKHADKPYWQGIALVAAGRFSDAEISLKLVPQKNSYFSHAQLTLANLMLTLNRSTEAEELLIKVGQSKDDKLSDDADIKLSELYLTQLKFEKASQVIDSIKAESPITQKTKQILGARLLFYKKDYQQAADSLDALLKSKQFISKRIYYNAVLTHIDAMYELGEIEAALEEVIKQLEKSPDSAIIHLLFDRLATWLTLKNLTSTTIGATNISLVDKLKEWSHRDRNDPDLLKINSQSQDLQAYAHYYYARYFSLSDQAANLKQALFEFSLFRLRYPTHLLAGASLIDTAKTQLTLGQTKEAIDTLALVEKINLTISPIARQQASFLHGELLADRLDFSAAAEAFKLATAANSDSLTNAATINTGISYLAASNQSEFEQLIDTVDNEKLQTELILEQALWLANDHSPDARPLLEKFISEHPKHQRINELHLTLAKHALTVNPVDPQVSAENIEILSAKTSKTTNANGTLNDQQLAELYTLKHQYAVMTSNYPLAIDATTDYIEAFPKSDRLNEFILLKGQALFRNGQQNQARKILSKFAKDQPESALTPYAIYYASLAARLEGTPQSQQEAIALFEKVTTKESPIRKEATLQLADLYRSLNQLDKAKEIISKIYNPRPKTSLDRDIAVNLASTYHDLGISDPINYQKAIEIYDGILIDDNLPDFWKNRVNYRKANTYQHMGENLLAEETYYRVINRDTVVDPITEWTWYYRCGFNAIAMLEEQANPKGAIAIALKLAESGGPRAAEAAERARQLEMKYMIWEE